jgi:D-alanyl-D-alanine carboxypeptidase
VSRMRCRGLGAVTVAAAAALAVPAAPVALAAIPAEAKLQRQLNSLVAAEGGPPGAIVTLRRGARLRVLTAGVADVRKPRAPRASDHMRIASVAKAFNGAVALRLVADGKLGRTTPSAPCCRPCRAPGPP